MRARSGLAARHHREWVPLIDEHRGVAFVVDDGSGQIQIDPDDAAIELRTASCHDTTGAVTSRDEAALLRRHRVSPLDGMRPGQLQGAHVALIVGNS